MKVASVRVGTTAGGAPRFDAGFHLSDGVRARAAVDSCPYEITTVRGVTREIFFGGRDKRVYVNDATRGHPFLSASGMLKSDLSSLKLISKRLTPNFESTLVRKGWIFISRSGTVGRCVFANGMHDGLAASEDVIRVVPNGKMCVGCLYAFLASKYGYALLTQGTFGSVINHVEPSYIKSLPVPDFPESLQQKIHERIMESARLREEADAARQKAIDYFSHYDVPKQPTVFAKKLSRFTFSFAAYNNNLDVDAIRAQYEDCYTTIAELSQDIFAPPLFKHIYLEKDNGNPFYTGREITFQNQRPYRYLSPRGVHDINDYKVSKGTLLVYKSGVIDGGMYGEVIMADANLDGACLSDHVIRITPRSFTDACWMYAFLKTAAGFKLLQALNAGTAIPYMTPERLSTIRIPRPNKEASAIEKWVSEYIDKRAKSNNLENEAIDMVEREIESWQEG